MIRSTRIGGVLALAAVVMIGFVFNVAAQDIPVVLPDRWPSGIAPIVTNEGAYGDVDASPTKDVMLANRTDAEDKRLFELSFGKRPAEELHDRRKDPFQMHNLAADPAYRSAKQKMSDRLTAYLKGTGDPRGTSQPVLWDAWPYHGNNRWKILPEDE